jgi:hypothetical protein
LVLPMRIVLSQSGLRPLPESYGDEKSEAPLPILPPLGRALVICHI